MCELVSSRRPAKIRLSSACAGESAAGLGDCGGDWLCAAFAELAVAVVSVHVNAITDKTRN
jgi:hypothetical protein